MSGRAWRCIPRRARAPACCFAFRAAHRPKCLRLSPQQGAHYRTGFSPIILAEMFSQRPPFRGLNAEAGARCPCLKEEPVKKMGKMSLMMLLGCGVMLAAFLILPRLGVRLGSGLTALLVLACPLSHILMMVFMGKAHGQGGHEGHEGHGGSDEGPVWSEKKETRMIAEDRRILLPAPADKN